MAKRSASKPAASQRNQTSKPPAADQANIASPELDATLINNQEPVFPLSLRTRVACEVFRSQAGRVIELRESPYSAPHTRQMEELFNRRLNELLAVIDECHRTLPPSGMKGNALRHISFAGAINDSIAFDWDGFEAAKKELVEACQDFQVHGQGGKSIVGPGVIDIRGEGEVGFVKVTETKRDAAVPSWSDPVISFEGNSYTYKQKAINARTCLATFQDDGWPSFVDCPLSSTDQLKDTIKGLNKSLNPIGLQFTRNGERIGWQSLTNNTSAHQAPPKRPPSAT